MTDRQRGFSLLEVLIAIAIVGMVLAVSATAGQSMYSRMQYHGAVRDVVGVLNSARVAAITRGKQQDVLIKPGDRTVLFAGKRKQIPDSIKVQVLGSRELNRNNAGVIRFYSDGSSSGGVVGLSTQAGRETEVRVDWLLGKVELCEENCRSFR